MTTSQKPNFSIDKQLAHLPQKIGYCVRCGMSNQRPRLHFDDQGVCAACHYADEKKTGIDWEGRKSELTALLDRHRSKTGDYDVIVPCSGGKDSAVVAHRLKHEFGMRPLTVTWAPFLYTDIGRRNLDAFVASGFDNVTCTPNGQVHRRLARHCFELLGDPFHAFVLGQMAFPFRMALQSGIKLVFYGENGEAEYAGAQEVKNLPGMPLEVFDQRYFKGVATGQFRDYGFSDADLALYTMPAIDKLRAAGIEMHWWGYYNMWTPQWNYYYAVENTGFQANPERSEGTYSKYASLDDKMDGIHYFMKFIKFGFARATDDAAMEVRSGHLTREEAVALIRRYDGELPRKYFQECLDYMGITEDQFWDVANRYRMDHIWERTGPGPQDWKLKQQVE